MTEPRMNASPAKKKCSSRIRMTAGMWRSRPVIEIAFGVSRDSIRRSRA